MKYKAAIFDMDGLLLDTERIFLDAFKKTCSVLGLEFDMSLFIKLIGTNSVKTKELLIDGFGKGFNYDSFRENWFENVKEYLAHNSIPLKEGAVDILEKIKSIHLPMAVATSTRYNDAVKSLDSTGILHYFKFIVAGDQVTKSKPDPEIYLKVADRLGVTPDECIVFEDSENGVKSAHAAGMDIIQIPDLLIPSNELKALAHRIYGSLNDVLRDFDGIIM
ncbi:MAG: HAD family phosphatase [Deltaproteobacteria bacterium]|nr:HAD family phosphatase [Deltaproteobacteria bacterium]